MTIASILSDLWKGGGGAFEAAPLPEAQELQKSPDGIGLSKLQNHFKKKGTTFNLTLFLTFLT